MPQENTYCARCERPIDNIRKRFDYCPYCKDYFNGAPLGCKKPDCIAMSENNEEFIFCPHCGGEFEEEPYNCKNPECSAVNMFFRKVRGFTKTNCFTCLKNYKGPALERATASFFIFLRSLIQISMSHYIFVLFFLAL